MGLRHLVRDYVSSNHRRCFSPVARIHGVATFELLLYGKSDSKFQSRCQDSWGCDLNSNERSVMPEAVSVPLPGFMGLRHTHIGFRCDRVGVFQSRCQDSWGCDSNPAQLGITPLLFQSRCQDSWGCDIADYRWPASCTQFQSRCQDSWGCDLPCQYVELLISCRFSPVARIHGVATFRWVATYFSAKCFSPVARIHGVATFCQSSRNYCSGCFSPVARIHGVATVSSRDRYVVEVVFQSRCQDSWGCDQQRPPH